MHMKKNGYVGGAVLLIPFSKQLRDHVEYEKYMCRLMVDNEETRKFKENTANLKDQLPNLRYNHPAAERLTAAGRKKEKNGS